ncbi:hypothetical protein ASG68_13860 [Rhizobium sp. Leaf453]|nr:hypothetical protein ASG42_19050 [Rhizobium sp. Leaf391]KQT06951.1 hypothetical protein ASG50_00500 [Rhizobium sp. Leaf386]KQT95094.1 hypothetical protein ASG68_13860 [Rhizobium sp. Leaf453]
MRTPVLADNSIEIDICAVTTGQPLVENGSGFTARFAAFIEFERTLDDFGDRTVFATGQAVSQIAGSGATD